MAAGDEEGAISELRQAIRSRYEEGAEGVEIASWLGDLGRLLSAHGNRNEAGRILAAARRVAADWGDVDREIVLLGLLGEQQALSGHFAEAERSLVTALVLRRAQGGGDALEIGDLLETIGLVYSAAGKSEAVERLAHALAITERHLGVEHPTTALRAACLATVTDDPTEKEELLKSALAILVRQPKIDLRLLDAVLVNYEKSRPDCGPPGSERLKLRFLIARSRPELAALAEPEENRTPLRPAELRLNPFDRLLSPVRISGSSPRYPEEARRQGFFGIVLLAAVITRNGEVSDVSVLRGAHPLLDRAAIAAVEDWKYRPAILNGCPVKVFFTITVTFRLSGGGFVDWDRHDSESRVRAPGQWWSGER